jgi:hypothetical protein
MLTEEDFKISIEEIRAHREQYECGLFESKKYLEKQRYVKLLERAETIADLKLIILKLIERI